MSGALRQRLALVLTEAETAGHGKKTEVYQRHARELGMPVKTLMTKLQDYRQQPRRRRADAGASGLTYAEAQTLSTVMTESQRGQRAKQLLSLEAAVDTCRANGLIRAERLDPETGEVRPLSYSAIARALRNHGLHPEQLTAPAPVTRLISKHPNHVWQIDASLCVLYYLRPNATANGLHVMTEAEFEKNKPANIARIEPDRVWRYVITDHASGAFYVEYVLGAESAINLVGTFIHAIQPRGDHPLYGVPYILMMDPGSANISGVAKSLFQSLQVQLQVNRPGQPRSKGQVEQANNLIECNFESALRFRSVSGLEHLNTLAHMWAHWFNGDKIHSRHGLTRYAAWLQIREDQLRIAPPEAVCRELARTAPESRVVASDLTVSYRGRRYHVDRVPGVLVGEKLLICRNPYRENGAQAVVVGADRRETYSLLEPVVTNEYGFDLRGAVIGEEYKARTKTSAQYANEDAERIAMGTDDLEDAAKLRKAKTLPFNGRLNPLKEAESYVPPAYLPKRGTALHAPARLEIPPLDHVTAAQRLKAAVTALGMEWGPERYAWLVSRYPDGVPEEAIEHLTAELTTPAAPQTHQLRAVK